MGLDIGSTSIRVASIKRAGEVFSLESIASVSSPQKGIASESLIDLQALSEVIKQAVISSNIRERHVALCLPEGQIYTKIIEMPQLSQQELSAALKFEMEQYIPLPIDKVKTDWEILGRNDEEGRKTMNVMLIAAPIFLLEKYQKIMEMAGFVPETIETEIISVHRALLPLISSPYSNMIVHMGGTSTTVAIVKDGVIRMVFSNNIGGITLTRSISLDLGIDAAQAESYKKAYGFNTSAFEGRIEKVLQPVVESIVADIKKAIFSYREKYNGESIKQVILSGGSALLPGIDVYLTNALSTQVVLGSAFAAYNMQNIPKELEVETPVYNVVVGLALRNLL